MPKYNTYPFKTLPEAGDTVLIYDATGHKNKQTYFSNFLSWIISGIRSATLSNLTTTTKTLEGSINEVKSNTDSITNYATLTTDQINALKALLNDD